MTSGVFPPVDEDYRVQVVRSLQVVERGHENFFDDLVGEVSARLSIPVCLVCFAGPDRACVHVKAANIDLAETIPRMGSFIEDVIEQSPRLLEVLDARSTNAYAMDELVLFPPHVRYLAGIQIVHDAVGIGALIVADGTTREPMHDDDANYLEQSAGCISEYLANLAH